MVVYGLSGGGNNRGEYMDLEKAREKIRNEVGFVNVKPYSHNIIGMTLLSVAEGYGREQANKLIDEFGLEKLGWKKA